MRLACSIALVVALTGCGAGKPDVFYLSCKITETIHAGNGEVESQPLKMTVYRMDEGRGRIFEIDEDGESEVCTGACVNKDFTDNSITYATNFSASDVLRSTETMSFNRIDGSVSGERTMFYEGSPTGKFVISGQCERHSDKPEIERAF